MQSTWDRGDPNELLSSCEGIQKAQLAVTVTGEDSPPAFPCAGVQCIPGALFLRRQPFLKRLNLLLPHTFHLLLSTGSFLSP